MYSSECCTLNFPSVIWENAGKSCASWIGQDDCGGRAQLHEIKMMDRRPPSPQCCHEWMPPNSRSTPSSPTCAVTCNFLIFRKRLLPCQNVLSVCERICKVAPGEDRLFHPDLKPSQRDKFRCFCFVCEFFFPHSSIHCLKQWGQCWPAKNSAIHAPHTLHSAYTC